MSTDPRDFVIDDLREDLAAARAEVKTWRLMATIAIEQIATLTTQNARLRQCVAARHEVYEDREIAA